MPETAAMDATLMVEDLKQEGKPNLLQGVPPRLPLKVEGLEGEDVQASTLLGACNDSDDDNWEELSESSGCSSYVGFCAKNGNDNKQCDYHSY